MDWDCIVVGGGPAGLSAALMLGRARRRVLVLDSGSPRNHAAREMHGVLGHDGLPPAKLREVGGKELARYDVRVRDGDPQSAQLIDGGVEIDGERARTTILATGLLDDIPALDGFADIYGVSAHTCPYCDGWEHRDERLAVLAPTGNGAHLGRLLRQWSGDVVVLTDGGPGVDADDEATLAAVGVPVVRESITRFASDAGRLHTIELAGREPLARDALFFYLAMRPRVALATALGCALDERGYIAADPMSHQTTVDRVYAAGNCTNPMHNVPMAIADGAMAGALVNHRLVEDGVVQPLTR